MKMKKINVEIKGTTDLLMNNYNIQAELDRKKGKRITQTYEPKEEAEKSCYRDEDGKYLVIPSRMVYASMLNASSFHKINRRSAKSILAGSIRVEQEDIPLLDKDNKPLKDYIIDNRAVVIQRARVIKSRAKIKDWKAKFTLIYNEQLIADPEIIKVVLTEAGMRIGIGDYRPQKSGWYGTFSITKFDEVK